MDSKRGRSISGQKGNQLQGSWIPVTPVKPILPRPQPIYADRQLNQLGQANWVGSDAFPPGFAPENQARRIVACCDSTNYAEVNRGVNHWEAALAAKSQGPSDNAGTNDPIWNNIPFVDLLAQADSASTTSQLDVGAASSPFMSNLNFQFIGDRLQSSSANLMHANKDLSLGSNLHINSNCTQGVPHYELPIPFRHAYDLNAPPGTIPDEVSSRTISQFAPITPDQSKRAENKHISYPARPMAVEASSKTIPQFAPITPDQARRVEKEHVSEVPKLCVDERTSQESDRQNNEVATTSEVNELHCDKELSQAVGDSSFAAVSTSFKENHNPDKGGNDGIDLNKTPQQKPRRKKHRPKVITEGKPKRTRKPATPKPAGSKENPTGKRKYVRKKGLNKPPTTPPPEVAGGTTDPKTLEPTTKSCRRALNFDLDDQARVESSTCRSAFNLNGESREGHFSSGRFQSRSSVQIGHGMEMMVENTQAGIAYDLNRSTNQILKDYISLPTRQAPSTPPPTKTDPPREKLKDDAQNENGTEGTCQVIAHDKEGKSVQILPKSTAHSAPRSPSDSNCSTSTSSAEGQARGKKREYSYNTDQADPSTMNMNGAQYNSLQAYQTTFQVNEFNRFSGMHFPEIYKKKRTEKGQNSTTSSTSSSVTAAKLVRLVTERIQKDAEADHFASKANCWISASHFNTSNSPATLGEAMRGVQNTLQTFECMRALGQKERLTKKRSKGTTRVRDLASLNGIADCKLLPTLPAKRAPLDDDAQGVEISQRPHACIEALVAENSATVARKKRTKKRNSLVGSVSYSTNEVQLHQNYVLYNHHKSLDNIKGPPPEVILKHMLSIEAIVERLRCLDINKESNKFAYQEHNALVLYNTRYQGQNALVPYNMGNQEQNALVLYHRDGTVVPFEGSFDPIKKRRPRPKVDLDDETTRVWKLLLANIDSEGINGTDEEKAKWWEEERRVFRGRADSFIARMHLVQGDRRFSQWKGSVVDSVIGVFLTQNVSDHLSSSAFMSLAAHFPLRSNHQPCYEEGTGTLMEEPEVCIVDPDDTIKWNEKMSNNPICDQNSMTLHDPEHNEEKEVVSSNEIFENGTGGRYSTDDSKHKLLGSFKSDLDVYHKSTVNRSTAQIMGTEAACFIREDRGAMEDIVSSQNSVVSSHSSADSSIGQTAERIGSSSGRNSEAQDPTTGSKPNKFEASTFAELLQMAEAPMLNECYRPGGGHVASATNSKAVPSQSECIEHEKQRQNMDRLDGPESSLRVSIIQSSNYCLHPTPNSGALGVEGFELLGEESRFSNISKKKDENRMSEQSGLTAESSSQATAQNMLTACIQESPKSSSDNNQLCKNFQGERNEIVQSQSRPVREPKNAVESLAQGQNNDMQQNLNLPHFSGEILDVTESTSGSNDPKNTEHKAVQSNLKEHGYSSNKEFIEMNANTLKTKRGRVAKEKNNAFDWDSLRKQAQANGRKREKTANTMDSLDWEAVRCADVNEIANTIKERGMNNMLAERIKDFLNRLVRDHGSIDLEWLRDVPPDKAKEYLLSVRGLGLKSVECVRLLTLHHLAFPVDTNVGRIAVRLGWVPLQPLPESLQLHLLELYPVLESIQKYLWPRLCKLDQRTLYELHYQMITFGKVFCTKSKPNCNACPMRGECRHFASAFASARLALPGPEEKSIVSATENRAADQNPATIINPLQLPPPQVNQLSEANPPSEAKSGISNCEPIIEVPATPEPESTQISEIDIEDTFYEDPDEIPTIKLNIEEFTQNLQNYMQENMELQEGDVSKALVALTPEAASIPTPKLKNVSRLRTEHQVYELPDSHPLLKGLDKREPDDPCSYLLAIWTPGETATSIQPPEGRCSSQEFGQLCNEKTCFSCNSIREANSQTVRGTLLIPCRTAMRGSFPLNGTYFQVNEVFADHDSSLNPIDVPRAWIWNLPRRTVYFGTSIPTIFKGLSTEGIQYCFWRGFVCVRGFDQKTRAPRPLMARLHFPASKLTRTKGKANDE